MRVRSCFLALLAVCATAAGFAQSAPEVRAAHAEPVWLYPRGALRDPVVPPAELYDRDSRSKLQVRTIIVDPQVPRRSRAVVRLLGPAPLRAVVGAGDRIGAYRIARVRVDGLDVVIHVLGADRPLVIPLQGDSARTVPAR